MPATSTAPAGLASGTANLGLFGQAANPLAAIAKPAAKDDSKVPKGDISSSIFGGPA